VPLLVRTWNLFHGNTQPPGRRAYVREMLDLATADRPDVVCLQEVPGWALRHLGDWTGYSARTAMTVPALVGVRLGRRLTAVHSGLVRSAFNGQGNAVLLAPGLECRSDEVLHLNPIATVRALGRTLGLTHREELRWARERRVCQTVRVVRPGGLTILVANLHATSFRQDDRIPDVEVLEAAAFAVGGAEPGEPIVLAGDFNVGPGSRSLDQLTGPDLGFVGLGPGIDHVLVRGATAGASTPWPEERRMLHGRLLSDHAPVEVTVE
jgi:endonuclease/exonuclease/phosphatase family metal-dependent hydrolase